jgi:site-specific DNA-methyltransferase (adenine-specific)
VSIDLGELRKVPIEHIIVGERARKDFGDISDLANNIREHGLIQPIVVYSPTLEPPYQLLGGERRLRALRLLNAPEVACRVYNKPLSDREMKAIELMENLKRQALKYDEEVALSNELHETLVHIYGEKIARSPDAPGHSMRDTARLLGRSVASVSKDIQLAKAIEKIPQLAELPSKAIASQVLKRMLHAVENRVTVNNAKDILANTKAERIMNSYVVGDTLEKLPLLPDDTYALIEVDPPYGIDLTSIRASESTRGLEYSSYVEVHASDYEQFCATILKECYRVGRRDSWLLWWCAPQWLNTLQSMMRNIGYELGHVPALWKKGANPGQSQQMDTYLGHSYEMFIYARKGEPKLRTIGRSNIFDFNIVHPSARIHPIERPVELMREILSAFTWSGAQILVPFAGSGTTITAAYDLLMTALGFDLSNEYKTAFDARVIKSAQQLELNV